jgi:hypothetical protein
MPENKCKLIVSHGYEVTENALGIILHVGKPLISCSRQFGVWKQIHNFYQDILGRSPVLTNLDVPISQFM